ncbi:MAG TPA: cupin domain-containing protein [Chloroflexaceae bacterium]|nr:cupin domain-containing protein [Chloroflexaceae bacterium]
MTQKKLGAQLRALRMQLGLSIRTLAARTGFSPSFISQLEADAVSPSIASLERITAELGVSLGQLFSSIESEARVVVRADERLTHHSAWSRCTVELLNDVAGRRRLSGLLVHFQPDGMSGKEQSLSRQETLATVLSGSLALELNGEKLTLGAGDSVYLDEGAEFRWHNHGDTEAVLLMVGLVSRREGPGAI